MFAYLYFVYPAVSSMNKTLPILFSGASSLPSKPPATERALGFSLRKKMNGSESLLAVKWVQTAESPAGPRAVSLGRQSDLRMRGAPLRMLQGHSLFPQPHSSSTPISLQVPVCVQRVPACARGAKDPTELFPLSPFQKNGPIHSCNR